MRTGTQSRRIVAGVALTLLLGAGPALTACSDDSSEDTATTAAATSTGAAASSSDSASATSSDEASAAADQAAGEGSGGAADAPAGGDGGAAVDLASAVLGAGDAPAGYTWVDTSGESPDADALAQMNQVFDQFSFSSPECQEQFDRNRELLSGGDQQGVSATYTKDADPQNSMIGVGVGIDPAAGDMDACDDATATIDSIGMTMSMKATPLDVTVDGAENVTAMRMDTTADAQGQSQTSTQSTVTGQVNGVWFSATSQGDVDQETLVALAQAQADRLRG